MLWVHIGMPKTGTTALQSYLHRNPGFLHDNGIHYMISGRDRGTGTARLICHNSLAVDMNRTAQTLPPGLAEKFIAEYRDNRPAHCVMSSEMFFARDLSALRNALFCQIDDPVRIVVYLRRFDDFIEADYKQRAKNGLPTGGAAAFVGGCLARIETDPDYMNFGAIFDRIQTTVPGAVIVPRLYLRDEMTGNNVIPDFLSLFGVASANIVPPETEANRTLSRLASEALGVFHDRAAGFDKKRCRRLGRTLQQSNDPGLFASGDVLTPEERDTINDLLERRNETMRQTYFPGRDHLFPPSARPASPEVPMRGDPEELPRFQYAVRSILKLLAAES
ncbi:hypothetical protein SAMN05443999_10122 [Roseovarius azorensis]|uniref:Sulfotransferase family protein n=1 Tax=Roseovarius azorensis TaxID=1287727 RepID=A0A1H7F8W7_9RHOB|nr:hypothetical protein [Roseovarius azorensis]SEK22573.1 hypothetical protein SAMN05443999_10122 [Roseovarius azorensis]